jgi:hypothetical protein
MIEAVVSLALFIIVIVTAMTMLFQMRAFAERQTSVTAPRQTARRAMDYLAYYVAGAADTNLENPNFPSPNALVMWYRSKGVLTQASYNNVTDKTLADPGTDIVTVVVPTNPRQIPVAAWTTGLSSTGPPAKQSIYLNYSEGCPATGRTSSNLPSGCSAWNDACNMLLFQKLTGGSSTTSSGLLQMYDTTGRWVYATVDAYQSESGVDCTRTSQPLLADQKVLKVEIVPEDSNGIQLPAGSSGAVLSSPVWIAAGLEYRSFRVIRTDPNNLNSQSNLEQKIGLFDKTTDNPYPASGSTAARFIPIIENVEDLQVAYLVRNDATGRVEDWNSASGTLPAADQGIPQQAGPYGTPASGSGTSRDVVFVQGVRINVVGRSLGLSLSDSKSTALNASGMHTLTAVEDRAARSQDAGTYDSTLGAYLSYERYRATTTLFLRNRMLGN